MFKSLIAMSMFVATSCCATFIQAGHDYPVSQLEAATLQLHNSTEKLKLVASRFAPSHGEVILVQTLDAKACQLLETLRCGAGWETVLCDYRTLQACLTTFEGRLDRYCALDLHPSFTGAWQCVVEDYNCLAHCIATHLQTLQYSQQRPLLRGHVHAAPVQVSRLGQYGSASIEVHSSSRGVSSYGQRDLHDSAFQPAWNTRQPIQSTSPFGAVGRQSSYGNGRGFDRGFGQGYEPQQPPQDLRTALVSSLLQRLLD